MNAEATPTRRATRRLLEGLVHQREELGDIADDLIVLLVTAERKTSRAERDGNDPPE
jgi:hypothetical protein